MYPGDVTLSPFCLDDMQGGIAERYINIGEGLDQY